MRPAGFEPAVPTNGRPRAYALDRAATGIGYFPPLKFTYSHSALFSGNLYLCLLCLSGWETKFHSNGYTYLK